MGYETMRLATILSSIMNESEQKCFLCFGTLLSFIRDRKFEVEKQDIDIGVIGSLDQIINSMSQFGSMNHKVVNDVTGEVLSATFLIGTPLTNVDLFLFKKKDGFYYHCFDESMERNSTGILYKYSFKGIPADCFDVAKSTIEHYQMDLRYGRTMSNKGTWNKLLPGFECEGVTLPLPFKYGACLDHFYPDWATVRTQFGVSKCSRRMDVKSCGDIKWEE